MATESILNTDMLIRSVVRKCQPTSQNENTLETSSLILEIDLKF